MASQDLSGRAASRQRRQMQVNGKNTSSTSPAPVRQQTRSVRKPVVTAHASEPQKAAPLPSFTAPAASAAKYTPKPAQKSASRQRRDLLASRGKSADSSKDRQRTEAMLRNRSSVNSASGECGCGGDCCKEASAKSQSTLQVPALSTSGIPTKKFAKKSIVSGNSGRMQSRARRAAMSGRGKAGLDAHGKGVSSASLARQANPDISSRDLARVVREQRSRAGAQASATGQVPRQRRPRNAADAMKVSGTKVGHTEKLTGDEVGLCHIGITGTEYMAAEVFDTFCQSEPPRAPKKVETTETLSGKKVTSGGRVGSSNLMTGAEDGNCQLVTGTEYLGREHFKQQCDSSPPPAPGKVSSSRTHRGTVISGPKSSRSENVSGNEKGTCQSVTGTPYTSTEQFQSFCSSDEQRQIRKQSIMSPPRGRDISGIQPGLSDEHMTGAEKGACQVVSGTPYLAETELKAVCGAVPAVLGESDFPQPLSSSNEVMGEFSVIPTVASSVPVAVVEAPRVAPKPRPTAPPERVASSVTGAGGYEGNSAITGVFSMGKGKVTGTEQSRFGNRTANVVEVEKKTANVPAEAARVTGEGIDTGLSITGDDWDRGDRVTGTEGRFAALRNPTRNGPMSAMPTLAEKREPQVIRESAHVTGGSGGSQGSAITVSGGARG